MTFLLYIWIKIKLYYGILRGYIGLLKKELQFVADNVPNPELDYLRKIGISYRADMLGNIKWDCQFDSVEVFKRGGADCNSLNRIVQVYYHLRGFKAYLVTTIADPFKLSHGTCILKNKDGLFYTADYGYIGSKIYPSAERAIQAVATEYKVKKIRAFIIQDINWNVKWKI